MPIPLSSIPEHIRSEIVQKTEYRDFLKLHESSQGCFKLAMKVRRRFSMSPRIPHEVNEWGGLEPKTTLYMEYSNNKEIVLKFAPFSTASDKPYRPNFCEYPVRFENYEVEIFGKFTEEFCASLVNFFNYTNCTVKAICFRKFNCSAQSLERLIEASKVQELLFSAPIPPAYLQIEPIRKVLKSFITHMADETDIVSLNPDSFSIFSSNITSSGVNRLLKKLLAENENFKRFRINTNQKIERDVILDGNSASFGPPSASPGRRRYGLNIRGHTIEVFRKYDLPNVYEPIHAEY